MLATTDNSVNHGNVNVSNVNESIHGIKESMLLLDCVTCREVRMIARAVKMEAAIQEYTP